MGIFLCPARAIAVAPEERVGAAMDGLASGFDQAGELATEFAVRASRHDRDATFPFENFVRLKQAGLLGATAPRGLGGQDAGLFGCTRLVSTIAEGCPSTALVLAMQLIHVRILTTQPAWPDAVRARIAHGAVVDGELVNTLRVEPALGTPARGGLPDTIARRTESGWALTGHKIYATGCPALRWMLVWARTDEPTPRVGNFLLDARAPGVRIVETWDHLGLRASASHDVLLDASPVPFDHAPDLRPPEAWGPPEADIAAWSTMNVSALYTGVAQAARDWLIRFLQERQPANLGAALATLPRMQEALGAIDACLLANRRLIASVAADVDRGVTVSTVDVNLIKTVAADNAIKAVQDAVALTGNHGLMRANPLERHLRDVLCARIHTPQPDSAHTAAGRVALGL